MASRITTFLVALIVAGTVVAGLIVGAQRDEATGPVDLIITNGRVFTSRDAPLAEAVAVRGNKILRVGTNREIKRLRRPHTVTIDAHGGSVLPGFIDGHAHLLAGGLARSHLDLSGLHSVDAIQSAIRAYAAAHPDDAWIRGRGWTYEAFPGGLPTRQQLDAIVPDRPAFFVAFDGHTAWVNTKALQLAGITRHTPDPAGGTIVRHPVSGQPTGALEESAIALVRSLLPEPGPAARLDALREAIAVAHAHGVTSVQTAGGSVEDLELLDRLRDAGELDLRVYAALSLDESAREPDLDRLDAVRTRFPDDPLLKAGAIKIMLDGVVETHTAALLQPYADRRTTGTLRYDPDRLTRLVTDLDRRGWQLLIHAIGDRAVRVALDALETARAINPTPPRGRRHRLEHVETIDPADIRRFASLGVLVSQQPLHASPGPGELDVWLERLGRDRARRGWLWQTLASEGARVLFGSDWPVVTIDPLPALHVATTRTSLSGEPEGGYLPEERMPLADAIHAYTAAGAYASFDDQRKGTLEPGMLADIVILTSDIFADGARLQDARVAMTIFDGRVVYDREQAAETD